MHAPQDNEKLGGFQYTRVVTRKPKAYEGHLRYSIYYTLDLSKYRVHSYSSELLTPIFARKVTQLCRAPGLNLGLKEYVASTGYPPEGLAVSGTLVKIVDRPSLIPDQAAMEADFPLGAFLQGVREALAASIVEAEAAVQENKDRMAAGHLLHYLENLARDRAMEATGYKARRDALEAELQATYKSRVPPAIAEALEAIRNPKGPEAATYPPRVADILEEVATKYLADRPANPSIFSTEPNMEYWLRSVLDTPKAPESPAGS